MSIKGKLKELPQSYTTVPPLTLKHKDLFPPVLNNGKESGSFNIISVRQNEIPWLENFYSCYQGELLNEDIVEYVHWAAYHMSQTLPTIRACDITALLPLFRNLAHTPAMVKHAMNITKRQIEFLNPYQTPVLVMDQPLFALAKSIQWEMPDLFGEDNLLLMMGGLHIEMVVANCLGDLLQESGWEKLITEAKVTTSGKALSLLKGKPVTLS